MAKSARKSPKRSAKPPRGRGHGPAHPGRGDEAAQAGSGADGLPTREDILAFVRNSSTKVGKREIARAFGIKGGQRIALKQLLAEMSDEGLLAGNRKAVRERGGLPPVTVLEIIGEDDDGDLIGAPAVWDAAEHGERPRVLILPARGGDGPSLGVGDRVLARIERLEEQDVSGFQFEARPIKRLPREKRRLLGIFRTSSRGGGTIEPVDRRELRSWTVQKGDEGEAGDGDLVRFDLARSGRFGVPQARVMECLGNPEDQRKISLIAIHAHGLPDEFPERVTDEIAGLAAPQLSGREDLRDVPLVTIDPRDARDHDDAVHAARDTDPGNAGGFVVIVAIADVAHYVRPGTRLDAEALKRGNSVYFPDRVVPMLPEAISNDLCSLKEGEDRPCLAVRMVFDKSGTKVRHAFVRGMMRSAAKLAYEEAQAAIDGAVCDRCAPLMDSVLKPLWEAYTALRAARDRRAPLELDVPERKIEIDAKGHVARVFVPERLDAHKLIEEFMIQANVAAAETLEAKRQRLIYRAHAEPSKEKLTALREFLDSVGLKLPPGGAGTLKPEAFNTVLERAREMPVADLVNEIVLRSQSQAEYTPQNYGHFGLNLRRYAHFTSPIRRYADLVVHRALIGALKLGPDGLADDDLAHLTETARSISEAERRAMAAERETIDRLIAAHLADRIGAEFDARVSGVTRSGVFVRLRETGADGFVPVSTLGDEYYHYIEVAHAMIGAQSGTGYHLGDTVRVKLVEAIPTAGALRFEMLSPGRRAHISHAKTGIGRRGRIRPSPRPRRMRR